MRSTAICYSPADSGTATELRCYLETNCPVAIEDGVVQMGGDLLEAVETGLSFDYVLVLLSPDSTEPAWPRARWESILVEQAKQLRTKIVYVLVAACKFPAVLRKEAFFDLSVDFAVGRRQLKRWLLARLSPAARTPSLPARTEGHAADIEGLETLADWPEFSAGQNRDSVLAFAHERHLDFEHVVWANCARRSRPGILGDMAHGLGLRLRGHWEENAAELREYCAAHRVLLVFENADGALVEMLNFGGRATVILVDAAEIAPRKTLAELNQLFSTWKRRSDACLASLGDVESQLDSPAILEEVNWPTACSLCSAAVALLKDYDRLAEAYDLLARISGATQMRGDLAAQGRVDWETSWILEAWDQPMQVPGRLAAEISEPTQLSLFATGGS